MNNLVAAVAFGAAGAAVSGVLTAAITGFAPMFALWAFMLIYLPGDERPKELLREMQGKKKIEQAWWVGQQIATMLFDGVPARCSYKIDSADPSRMSAITRLTLRHRVGRSAVVGCRRWHSVVLLWGQVGR